MECFHYLYFEVIGNYHNVGNHFKRLERDIGSEFGPGDMTMTGVFFDNPTELKDSAHARCAVGAKLNTPQAIAKAKAFCRNAPKYKLIELPTVNKHNLN